MSLINDALKRTKDAQQQNPPPPSGPPLKPADPAEAKTASNAKTLLYIMVACVVFGNALLFFAMSGKKSKPAETSKLGAPTPVAAPPTNPAPVAVVPPAPAPEVMENVKREAATAVVVPPVIATNPPVEQPVAVAPPEPPKPAPLKLQSIIFNASRSSAMISGKFVFVGDKVQGYRVTAIDQETVTLIGNGQTNVLSLP